MPKIPPVLERMLVGGGLGMLISSGAGKGVGARLLAQFLQPLSKNDKAIQFIARVMYEREEDETWINAPKDEKKVWISRATNAVDAMTTMLSQALGGKVAKEETGIDGE